MIKNEKKVEGGVFYEKELRGVTNSSRRGGGIMSVSRI